MLAGPIPGALTGFLANILWTYVVPPPFQRQLRGGLRDRGGGHRPAGRHLRPSGLDAAAAEPAHRRAGRRAASSRSRSSARWPIYAYGRFYRSSGFTFFGDTSQIAPVFVILGWLVAALVRRRRRRLPGAALRAAGPDGRLRRGRRGRDRGSSPRLISAPITANVFSGVTGAGTDFLVAAFRQAGSDIQAATFQQGLLSDPVDKLVTFFTVYLILNAMARRTKARFPQGERLRRARATLEAAA